MLFRDLMNNVTDSREIDDLIIEWGKTIFILYDKLFKSAKKIFKDFKFKIENPFLRIDVFWEFNGNVLSLGAEKTLISDKNWEGIFIHPSKKNLPLDLKNIYEDKNRNSPLEKEKMMLQDSLTFEIENFPLEIKNIQKVLRTYSATNLAKQFIEHDLEEYSRKKEKNQYKIIKNFWRKSIRID
jgi:hypothetical protein